MGPFIAVIRMETVIHIALEVVGAMKPRAGADKAVAVKPLRAVVARRSTGVRSDIIVTIGTFGSYSDADAVLGVRLGGGSREAESRNSGKN
jgi:hypothetical protein